VVCDVSLDPKAGCEPGPKTISCATLLYSTQALISTLTVDAHVRHSTSCECDGHECYKLRL